MKRTLYTLGLIGLATLGTATPLQAQSLSITKGPFRDANLGIAFGNMAEFQFQKATFHFDVNKGYLVQYGPPHGGRLCVSVTPFDEKHAAVDSPRMRTELQRDREALQERIRTGALTEVRKVDEKVITVRSDGAAARFLYGTTAAKSPREKLLFHHCVMVHQDRLVSVRLIHPADTAVDSEAELRRFLGELARLLAPEKPASAVSRLRK